MELTALLLSIQYEGKDLLGVFASTELAENAAEEYLVRRGEPLGKCESFVYMGVELNQLQ
jgi:hypothetical protein